MGQDTRQSEERRGSPDTPTGGRGPTARVAQPDEFFPLASEEMIRRGEISHAIEHCRRGLVFYPDNISGYAVLANAYLLLDEPTRAANVLRDGHRRTRAVRLLELADAIEREAADTSSPEPSAAEPVASARRSDRKPSPDEVATPENSTDTEPTEEFEESADVAGHSESTSDHSREMDDDSDEETPLIPIEIEDDLSPTEQLSHIDAEEAAAVESKEAKEEQIEQESIIEEEDPEELSFISDDPASAPWAVSRDEDQELNPYVSDESDDEGGDEDVTERLIVRGDTSLFGNEVRPSNQDLFTGEPLPTDESFLQESEQETDGDEPRESEVPVSDFNEGGVDLIPPVEDIIVPAPDPGSTLHEENVEAGEQLIPMPERREREEPDQEMDETKEVEERAATPDDRTEESQSVSRPVDPTAGMAAGEGRGEGGDLVDLIDDGKSRDSVENESIPSQGLSLHSGTQISDLRSRNLRLIPGLEYAPLRKDDSSLKIAPLVDKKGQSSADISGMPPLGGERTRTPLSPEKRFNVRKAERGDASEEPRRSDESDAMTPLEKLARRLETARIPVVDEEPGTEEKPRFEPSLVSDTFAGILVSQGAYGEAIKAYQMLARLKPDRRDEYEKKIAEIHWKMDNVTDK